MDLLKATKTEILEAFNNAREIGENQDEFELDRPFSAIILIPMRGKNCDGFRLIGSMLLGRDNEPLGKISRPVADVDVNVRRYDFKLLPCGFWILIAKQEYLNYEEGKIQSDDNDWK